MHCLTQMLFCWKPFRKLFGFKEYTPEEIAKLHAEQQTKDPFGIAERFIGRAALTVENRQRKVAQHNPFLDERTK